MCGWSIQAKLFENKSNDSIIAVRDYGCGAFDTDLPTTEIYKIDYFLKYFIRIEKIDTAQIDKTEWVKIE